MMTSNKWWWRTNSRCSIRIQSTLSVHVVIVVVLTHSIVGNQDLANNPRVSLPLPPPGHIETAWLSKCIYGGNRVSSSTSDGDTTYATGCWVFLSKMSIIVELLDFKDTDRSRKHAIGSIRETLSEQGTRLGAGIETYSAVFNSIPNWYQTFCYRPWSGVVEFDLCVG